MRRSTLRTLRDFRQKNSLWGGRAQMAFVEIKFTSHCDDLNEIKKGTSREPQRPRSERARTTVGGHRTTAGSLGVNCDAGNWQRSTNSTIAGARSQPVVLALEQWADPDYAISFGV